MELPVISNTAPAAEGGGCASSGCGTAPDALGHLPDHIRAKVQDHPCYSEEAHHYFARMHVAVAPACNIQCNYCNRKYDCSNESRPGVVSEVLTPDQAIKKVLAVAAEIPQMTVLGIAGPGDPLANPGRTFETFEQLSERAPDIKLCVSTNGLNLPLYVDRIAQHNIDHVTITINCVDPEVGAKIYPWIFWENKRIFGVEGARILIEQQQKGLQMLTDRGILVKVNSVLIPGVNDEHLKEVSKIVKAKGAFLHNVMPLIAEPEHGTYYGIMEQPEPTPEMLQDLQDACAGDMAMMRHCRQCRADAVGLLGEDRSEEFTLDKIDAMGEIAYDLDKRQAYQAKVELERQSQHQAKVDALAAQLDLDNIDPDMTVLMAVATEGHGKVNQHFGHATEFQIFEVNKDKAQFVGHRRVDLYCQGGYGEDEQLPSIVRAINDCHAVLVAKIGACPRDELKAAGIEPVDEYAHEYIEKAALSWFGNYRKRIANGELRHVPRGDAEIRQGALTAAAEAEA